MRPSFKAAANFAITGFPLLVCQLASRRWRPVSHTLPWLSPGEHDEIGLFVEPIVGPPTVTYLDPG